MRKRGIVLLLAAVVLLAGSLGAADKRVFLGSETYSVRGLMSIEPAVTHYDMISVMPLFKSLGMKGVSLNEMWMKSYTDKAYLDRIKKSARDNGLTITTFIIKGDIAQLDDVKRNRQIEQDKIEMRAAAYLGAPIVRVNLGTTGDEARDATVGTDRCIAAIKELIPLAKELKLKIVLENHGGVSKKADNIIRIIKETDPKIVGALLDFKNWPADVVYQECAKIAPYAWMTHAKAHAFDDKGEETKVSYERILQMLKDAKYRGPISIEFEGKGDQIEGLKKTRDLILKYWPTVDHQPFPAGG